MSTNCISGNIPQIWRLSGVTRTIRCVIDDAEGEPRDLSDITLAVVVSRDNTDFRFSPSFVVEGEGNNIVKFGWPADKQGVGDYTIEVTGVDGSGNVDRVNWHGATGIRLVDYTNEVRGDCPAIMSDEPEIGLEGEYTMNGTGMSAYEEWLADGHEGTPHDFILWLQEPATTAAAAAEAQMVLIQGRADEDHTRAGNDHTRAESDHGTASSDHTRAGQDHDTAAEDHRVAGIDHGTAADDHTRAGQDHQTASDDHTQAGSDHTRAGEDHQTASSDHTRAGEDHTTAGSDHTRAGEDHTQAGNDHTRAEADHGIAADDHTQAAADHTQAVSDHETWADKADTDGYYERMGVGTAKNLEGVVSQSAEFIYRKTGGSASVDSGLATMSSIKGKSLVWNQLISETLTRAEAAGITRTAIANCGVHYQGTSSKSQNYTGTTNISVLAGHKYFLAAYGCPSNCRIDGTSVPSATALGTSSLIITQGASITVFSIGVFIPNGAQINNDVYFKVIDLTLMFGAGNEPSTVAEFEAMYHLPYYAHNAGEIVSNKATAIETVGFNQWDEEWEVGAINSTTGENQTNANVIRSKDYIQVFSGGVYNFTSPKGLWYMWYDGAKTFLSAAYSTSTTFQVTAPSNAKFLRIQGLTAYGNVYNHDICINLSDAAKNGTYEPYSKHTLNLNLPTLTGKLNGEGTSVVIAPEGMAGQDGWEDLGIVEDGYLTKIIKKTPRVEVDLGDLSYTHIAVSSSYPYGGFYAHASGKKAGRLNLLSQKYIVLGDFTTDKIICGNTQNDLIYIVDSAFTDTTVFKTAVTGVKLIYELAEPQTYVLDNPVYVGYLEDGGGTERRLPEDTSSSVIAPFSADIVYPINAVGALQKLPENFISKESMQAFLASLGTQMGGTWTMTWNATTGKYTFTFTPNA